MLSQETAMLDFVNDALLHWRIQMIVTYKQMSIGSWCNILGCGTELVTKL